MKKIIKYCLLFILLITIVSCSCKKQPNGYSTDPTETPQEVYTITYDNLGKGRMPAKVWYVTNLPAELPILSEAGYSFNGWYYDTEFINAANANDKLESDVTLYAYWEEATDIEEHNDEFCIKYLTSNGKVESFYFEFSDTETFAYAVSKKINIIVNQNKIVRFNNISVNDDTYYSVLINNTDYSERIDEITLNSDLIVTIQLKTKNTEVEESSFIFELRYFDDSIRTFNLKFTQEDTLVSVLERNFRIVYYDNHAEYGLSIIEIDDMVTDWNNTFIGIYINDEFATVGVSFIPLVNGMRITFKQTNVGDYSY